MPQACWGTCLAGHPDIWRGLRADQNALGGQRRAEEYTGCVRTPGDPLADKVAHTGSCWCRAGRL